MAATLQAESIRKDYPTRSGPLNVLRDVSLELSAGEAIGILGPSGSGKSTLLNILGTLEPPTAGRLIIEGHEPLAMDEPALAAFRNRRIGFVFQDHHLLPHCCVLENVLIPTLTGGPAGRSAVNRAVQLLGRVGLSKRLDHRPAELSGGEKQRVAVARALVNEPAVILADEPTGNLDRQSASDVADLLLDLHKERGALLVVVTHSLNLADRLPRRFELTDGALNEAA